MIITATTPTPRSRSPSPSSSSSSDFEFTVSLSPSSRSKSSSTSLCPADELFYKGQLLPLHLSPRISMLRTLLLSSSSTNSSSDTNTTASRDSNGSTSSTSSSSSSNIPAELLLLLHPECDSSRPSSVNEEETTKVILSSSSNNVNSNKRNKYLASFANRFSSVFLNRGGSKKVDLSSSSMDIDLHHHAPAKRDRDNNINASSSSSAAKQVIKKYVNKVKRFSPLQKTQNQNQNGHNQQVQQKKKTTFSFSIRKHRDITLGNCSNIVDDTIIKKLDHDHDSVDMRGIYAHSHSFSGNLRFPRRKKCAGSCPSSMRSSPTHSGLLRIGAGSVAGGFSSDPPALVSSSSSSMEELQSAIQGAIAHCKSSMILSHHKKPVNVTTTVN